MEVVRMDEGLLLKSSSTLISYRGFDSSRLRTLNIKKMKVKKTEEEFGIIQNYEKK